MHPIPPLLMIPTTSGTGADVSQFCIVTDTGRSVKIHRSAAAHHDARVAQGRRTDVDTSALIRAIRDISRGGSAFDARSAAAMVRGDTRRVRRIGQEAHRPRAGGPGAVVPWDVQ